MVPNVAKVGTSFKGAFAYYLHDKRQAGEVERTTSDRVAWTDTRNLATDDPDLAAKIMAATATDQERLKQAAGIKNTGRKSPNSVYAYSIAWHPDEAGKINKAEMIRAADESLRAIGAGDRQAVFVCHNDEPHPHVHVIVNRVSMEDGRMLSTSNDFKKLDAWALAYRKERGEELKYCPARQEKADAIKRKAAGEDVDFVRGEKSVPRGMADDFKEARNAANDNRPEIERERQAKLDAALNLDTRQMKHRHKTEWVDLSDRYRHKKEQIYTHSKEAITRTKEQIKEQFRPAYRDMYRAHHQERQDRAERDKHIIGKIQNVMHVLKHRKVSGMGDESKGWVAAAFNFMTSRKARTAALERLQKAQVRGLRQAEKEEIARSINAIKDDRSALLSSARKTFNVDRAALIARQADERTLQKKKWQQRAQERARAFNIITFNAQAKNKAKAEQRPKHSMKQEHTRGEHKAATEGRKPRKRKGRVRVRRRSRTEE